MNIRPLLIRLQVVRRMAPDEEKGHGDGQRTEYGRYYQTEAVEGQGPPYRRLGDCGVSIHARLLTLGVQLTFLVLVLLAVACGILTQTTDRFCDAQRVVLMWRFLVHDFRAVEEAFGEEKEKGRHQNGDWSNGAFGELGRKGGQ